MSRKQVVPRVNRCRLPHQLLGAAFVGTAALIGLASQDARAEGSAQLGQISDGGDDGLMANAVLFVDVLTGEDTLNIAARGAGDVGVTVTPVNADGSLGTPAPYTLTNGNGLITQATVPATLPNGGNIPLRVAVTPGRYQVVFGEAVEPFDLSVTTGSVTYTPGALPTNGGRLSSKDWRFFADLPGAGEIPMNANFFVRAPVGEDYEYIWKLDFSGLLGGQMCLTANDLGLPGDYVRSSQPYSAITGIPGFDPGDRFSLCDDLSLYDIYVNPPNERKPEPPTPNLEAFGIGSCGAVLEGSGGVFSFDAELAGTYLLVIDVNRDDVFDAKDGDIAFNGLADAGANSVPWDGRDSQGQLVPAGDGYAARVFLRLGEFHFTGSDIEAVDPGITVARVASNNTETPTKLYWDDEALSANNFNSATLAPTPTWSTPNGVNTPHAWRGASTGGNNYNGPGENSFIDTWVFGTEQTADVQFDVVSASDDADGDGLINGRECAIGSLVNETDTDGDGVLDGQEEASSNLNDPPTDRDNDGTADALDTDDDEDGIPTSLENPDPNSDDDSEDAQDSDNDGTPDYLDEDDDGDGIVTSEEGADAGDLDASQDSDEDGIPDYLDDDDDGDGVPTDEEVPDENEDGIPDDAQNSDDDGTPDYLDDDDDNDGIPTEDETGDDNDNDIPDYLETPVDTDGDGVTDDIECPGAANCPDTDDDGEDDITDTDDDGDGILTADEDLNDDGDPRNDDSDDDDIANYLDPDDDNDGISTATEVTDGAQFGNNVDGEGGPNWLDTDADGDGVGDGTENSGDGDVNDNDVPDYLEPDVAPTDTDGDGIVDSIECPTGTDCPDTDDDGDPDVNDTDDDGDGILTSNEAPAGNAVDSDDDDIADYLDRDDDNDGVWTLHENPDPNADGSPADAQDTNSNGTPDYLDPDDDGDGIDTDDEDADPNGDGNPRDAIDSDEDGTPDYLDGPATGVDGGGGGPDETEAPGPSGDAGTSADGGSGGGEDTDSDGDGLPDAVECPGGTNCPDFDNDDIPDYLDADDDGDGVPTSVEDLDGDGDPRNDDTDDDDEPNYLDTDDDNDGILTKFEDINGNGNPADDNSDKLGLPNYLDPDDDEDTVPTRQENPDPNQDGNPSDAQDTDDDGKPDYLDADDDGDGLTTVFEVGGDPDDPRDSDDDGIPDYLDDEDDRPEDELPRAAEVRGGGFGCAVGTTPASSGHGSGLGLIAVALGVSMFMRRRNKAAAAVIVGAAATVTAVPAQAQETSTGFAINRYNPSERGSDWFVGESLDLRGHGRVAAGLVFDWAYKPLVSYDANGDELAAIIENQLYGHVGLSVNLWERLRLAASFPVLFYQNGTPVEYDGTRYATREGAEVGDLRLGADLRLFGEYGDAATLAIGAQVTLPTGTQDAYTSDGHVRFLPRAALAGDLGIFAYSAQAGLDYRGLRVDYADAPFGTDMRFAATLGLRLADKALLLGPELWGSTVISDSGDGFFEEDSTPFEGIFGAHYFAGDWRFGAGVGPGFTRGLGAPALRVLASIEWFPAIEEAVPPPPEPLPVDTDGDGIFDDVDACPTVAGVADSDPTKNGCPPRRDTDKDGIFDDEDACVTDAGVANEDKEKHGCPPDTDGDGILDRDDACVSEPGPKSEDPKKHGCPLPKDTDGDTIIDPEDACPDKAGPASDEPAKHGCPRAEVSGERVVILDRIEFDTGKATIRPESNAILEAVRAVLEENPQIKKLRVEGHTDNRGARNMNVGLSRRRAAAVVKWLVDNGISQDRLTSQGLGPDKPVDSNDTDSGRQNNRRVEFHITETSKPASN